MRKAVLLFYCFIVLLLLNYTLTASHYTLVYAACEIKDYDNVEEYQKAIAECQEEINARMGAHSKNKTELASLEDNLEGLKKLIASAETKRTSLENEIFQFEVELGYQKEIFDRRVRNYYIRSRRWSPFLLFLSSSSAAKLTRELNYRQTVAGKDKQLIIEISQKLKKLITDKENIETNKAWLAQTKASVSEQAEFYRQEVEKVEGFFIEVSSKIAELSVKQQALLAEKLASLNLPATLGAGPLYCTDDRNIDPGFRPAFAFYTFGIPHRVGMNQYGAYGRAKAGQGYQDILKTYFNGISFESGKENIQIKVQGHGQMPLDEYLLGIYEMPESWDIRALKAQAVAARSYALAYTNNGQREICTTQACQVWKPGKKTGQWKQAVEETKGEIMVSGGQPIKAWYASTAGGYMFNSGDVWHTTTAWTKRMRDTTGEINSFSDLFEKAYDKDSPCFYSAQGWRKEYGKSAWLKSEEVADIVNVLLLAKADSSTQKHLPQVDKPNPDGVETWDAGRVKQELQNRKIALYHNISDVSVSADFDSGITTTVHISGDIGNKSFNANEFRDFFNLRAPANIQIVGPLFNIEKK